MSKRKRGKYRGKTFASYTVPGVDIRQTGRSGIEFRGPGVTLDLSPAAIAMEMCEAIADNIVDHIERGESPTGRWLGKGKRRASSSHVPGVRTGKLRDSFEARITEDTETRGTAIVTSAGDQGDADRARFMRAMAASGKPLIALSPETQAELEVILEEHAADAWQVKP